MLALPATNEERIDYLLMRCQAFDPASGARLVASRGRRKPGRPTNWLVLFPPGDARESIAITAATLDEALARANARLAAP